MHSTPMKAIMLHAPGELHQTRTQSPTPNRDEVLVRVTHSGVCGTDLKIYHGDIPVPYPLIMGHELAGEVVAGGESAGLEEGARVVVDPVFFCGGCFHCRRGQTHLCPAGGLLGRDRHGGFADYVAVPAGNVYPLPDEIDSRLAPLLQVLTTCLHAQRLARIFPGDAVAVLGLGVTGQLHLQLAKARGACPVIGITRSPQKRELATRLGADFTFPPGELAKAGVLEITGGRGADVVIESAGVATTFAEAIRLARAGGQLLAFGITTRGNDIPFYQLYFKELSILHARAAKGEDYPAAIELVQHKMVQLEPLVSHTMPLEALEQALHLLADKNAPAMKIILEHT
ncbi:MAG: hypothetical protein D6796_06110 [Caldilineae bacterium]|nr:MAG: hypothetical protein D6796_06110 [Caldilineae bacterium]